ncbi:MAG: mechanosensitive ion channel [Ectothiorhodospiraceae bacterium]|nr:mechanosensitive ion channel [Ectothiorhodospiraceae bacterium]
MVFPDYSRLFPLLILPLILALLLPTQGLAETSERPLYGSLADILEDEEARNRLIQELRQLSAEEGEQRAAEQDGSPSGQGDEEFSLARQVANTTQSFAERMVSEFSAGVSALSGFISSEAETDWGGLLYSLANLTLIIVATVALFLVFRRLARPGFAAASRWALESRAATPTIRKTAAALVSIIIDLAVLLVAWVGGYLLALFVVGETGGMQPTESLFLNAFLLVETFKLFIRVLFASKDDGLRLLPMRAEDAEYWNAWLAKMVGFIGYGILLIVPVVNYNIAPAMGRVVTLLIMALAFLYALVVVSQNRTTVSGKLRAKAEKSDLVFLRVIWLMLARSWHLLTLAYVAALAIVTLVRPDDALPIMLQATLQTLLAVGVGVFVSVVLSQLISRGFKVPEETRQRFPTLENRLNGFIPMALKIMRAVILIVVIAVVLDAWGAFDLISWLGSEAGISTIGSAITIALILAAATGLWIGLASWIEERLNPETGIGEPSAREKTLLTIFRNAVAVTLTVMTLMIVLSEVGVNIGPLIAGAGVLGLAIGFGAQKLVQDIITGIFIQLENAINAGDVITAGGITGTAEKLTIRSLGIRDLSGTYHLIPFSSVDSVSNYMREFAYHVGEYGVAYREDTDEVIVRLREAFDELMANDDHRSSVLGELEVHGVTALADSSVNIRVRIKTLPGMQWAIGREYNRLVKRHLDAAGIEIPFPHLTLYFGQDKDGSAPAAPIVVRQSDQKRLSSEEDESISEEREPQSDDEPAPEEDHSQDDRAKANPKNRGDYDDADD